MRAHNYQLLLDKFRARTVKNAAKDRLSGLWEWHFDAFLTDSRARKNSKQASDSGSHHLQPAVVNKHSSENYFMHHLIETLLHFVRDSPLLRTCRTEVRWMFHRISYGQKCSNAAASGVTIQIQSKDKADIEMKWGLSSLIHRTLLFVNGSILWVQNIYPCLLR